MLVAADRGDKPVAYFWGSLLTGESVLEVRHDMRGRGIGACFVSFLLAEARATGATELKVECAPNTSASFWRKMGFDVARVGHRFIGKRLLERSADTP